MKRLRQLFPRLLAVALVFGDPVMAQEACDFGAPDASMPREFGQYQFLIGDFEVHIHVWKGDGWSQQYQEARWTGRYILGGRAVMDEWFPFDPDVKPDTPGGVNIRMYDPTEGLWKLMWMRSDQLVPTELRSQLQADGKMRLWRIYPTPDDRKVIFETLDQDTWARTDYVKDKSGENWVPKYRLEARRRSCVG